MLVRHFAFFVLALLKVSTFCFGDELQKDPFKVVHADAVSHGSNRQELLGDVIVERDEHELHAGRMVYSSESGLLEAWRNVAIKEEDLELECRRLSFSTRKDEAVAWGDAKLHQKELRGRRRYLTTLSGVQIRLFTKEKRVQVLENVLLTRYLEEKNGKSVELRVSCRALDALYSTMKSTFKGNVEVETSTVGARAQRAIFDQRSGKFYLLGNAQAWNFDASGNRINIITGDKIVYFTKEKRTVVIGNVTASVEPELQSTERKLPLSVDTIRDTGEFDKNE